MTNQNQDIISYFEKLDRSLFMDTHKEFAYLDEAIPIGHEQTISQPSLVLSMTMALHLQPHSKVLEIGTGSGFQSALLAAFSGSVYTIERIEALYERAKERLRKPVSRISILNSTMAAPVGKSTRLMTVLW